MISTRTVYDLKPLEEYLRVHDDQMSGRADGPIRQALYQWLEINRRYLRTRFQAEGFGAWPALAPSTIAAKLAGPKRKHRNVLGQFMKSGVYMLRDTDTLFNALAPGFGGGPGWEESILRGGGIEAGYGGGAPHPSGDGSLTIADLASYHASGGPTLPVRQIVVDPDDETLNTMAVVLDDAIGETLRATGNT